MRRDRWVVLPCALGLLLLGAAACVPRALQPEEAIIGKWVNVGGGTIFFYDDLSGYIPGDATQTPAIPDASFTYYFIDDTHLRLSLEGQPPLDVEVIIRGDKLTWFGRAADPNYVYRRSKQVGSPTRFP